MHENNHTTASNPIIALVGGSGKLGTYVLHGLRTSPYGFEVRTLSRRSEPPEGSRKENHFRVDFDDVETLQGALQGCAFLINCMGTSGDYHNSKTNLVRAAAAAGVYGYITSDFGIDYTVSSTHFDHRVWTEKKDHVDYAKSLGLRTIAVFSGLFLEEPFGAFGPWHGFDPVTRRFTVAGTGEQPISITSKVDIGMAVARICHMILTTEAGQSSPQLRPLGKKTYMRISGVALSPCYVVNLLNSQDLSDSKTHPSGPKPQKWKVEALTTEDQRSQFQASMKLVAIDDVGKTALDSDTGFDQDFANDIAGRIFRAMGDGTLNFSENDNEILNPAEKYWKWTLLTNFEADTRPKTLWNMAE